MKTFSSDTVTAGGASQTFTLDVTNSGVSDADNVNLTDTVDPRLVVDSIARATTPALRRASRSPARSAHLAAGATKSITVTYHVATATDSATRRREHGDASLRRGRRRRRAATRSRSSRTSSSERREDVRLAHGHGRRRGQDVHDRRPQRGVSDADNVSLTDTVDPRLVVDSIAAGDYTCGAREPVDLLHARRISRRARRSRSRSRTTSTRRPRPTRRWATRRTRRRTRTRDAEQRLGRDRRGRRPGRDEDVRRRRGRRRHDRPHVHGRRAEHRRVGGRQRAVTDTVDSRLIVTGVDGGDLRLRRDRAQTIACSLAHLAAGATKSITVTYRVAASTAADRERLEHG